MCTKRTCYVTLYQVALIGALHFCWLYKCQHQQMLAHAFSSFSLHYAMLTSVTAADGWDAAPAPQAQQAQFGNADQFGAQY